MSEKNKNPAVAAEYGEHADANVGQELSVNSNGHLMGQPYLKLHFSQVSYFAKQNDKKVVTILNDTYGEFHAGRLAAILGPSGAGKTSMLNVLSGFKANGVTGQFTFNGKERNLLAFRKMSCYIPQDFALLDLLSVEETMHDSADLKLPTKVSLVEKQKIIDDILHILNMEHCRHRLVRNLSGGERKRLSIAIELVTNPPVMFFDEPTSGLDSVASLQVINYLSRLARDGRIIVCVIHQPSSRLMKLFDDVLVMSRGQVLYAGPQREMIPTFEAAGFMFPNYYNPADFVLDVASEEHNENALKLIARNKERHCVDRKCINADVDAEATTKMLSYVAIEMNAAAASTAMSMSSQRLSPTNEKSAVIRPKAQVSLWRQFTVLVRRSFRTTSRNLIAVQLRVLMHIVVAALVGAVYWQIGNDGARVLSNAACVFFLIMFIFFGNAMPSILLCPQETMVFVREYLNGWYSISAYYASKLISDIPLQFACPTFFATILYFMTNQPDDMARFAMFWGISQLLAINGHFMGLAFGSTFDMQLAILLVPGVSIPFMIFSGFFIRIHELAPALRPLCDISFFRYTLEGQLQAIYGYNRPDLECHSEFCYFKSPQKFLKELDMLGDLYGTDLLALFLWLIFFKALFFLSLLWRIKRAQ